MKIDSGIPPVDQIGVAARPVDVQAERRELIQAVHAINASEMFGDSSELTFSLDQYSKRPVIRLVDKKTKEVVQQIPTEEVLRLAQDLSRITQQSGSE